MKLVVARCPDETAAYRSALIASTAQHAPTLHVIPIRRSIPFQDASSVFRNLS
ncbi:hypothetical protein [Bradyrhizobium sp. SZCCHNPS1003]|uniref:hypothetical protein n=1 Tax=Bradyrhizobium sp. SZCCHNPS1003 TaxID=3057330 RepID=UPI0028ECEB79|nr:hypothetical protein [Bradyrhizobium sp. SZCCHNPS1003]